MGCAKSLSSWRGTESSQRIRVGNASKTNKITLVKLTRPIKCKRAASIIQTSTQRKKKEAELNNRKNQLRFLLCFQHFYPLSSLAYTRMMENQQILPWAANKGKSELFHACRLIVFALLFVLSTICLFSFSSSSFDRLSRSSSTNNNRTEFSFFHFHSLMVFPFSTQYVFLTFNVIETLMEVLSERFLASAAPSTFREFINH